MAGKGEKPDAQPTKPEKGQEEVSRQKIAEKTAKLGGEVAAEVAKPTEEEVQLLKGAPNNQFGRMAAETAKFIKENPNADGPLSRGILSILIFLAKNIGYFDYMPGHFYEQLDEDPSVKDLVLSQSEAEKLQKFKKDRQKPELTPEEKQKLNAEDAEAISSSYVARWLFGAETKINDAKSLGAALKHTTKIVNGEAVPYYKGTGPQGQKIGLGTLKRDMPAGTVLIFIANSKQPTRTVGVATGNETEFEYMDATGTLQKVDLNDPNQTIIKSELNLIAAFVPQFNTDEGYFAKNPQTLDGRFDPIKAKIKSADLIAREAAKSVDEMLTFESQETTRGEIYFTRAGYALDSLQKSLSKIDLVVEDLKKSGAFKPADFVAAYKILMGSLVKVKAYFSEAKNRLDKEISVLEGDKEKRDKEKSLTELRTLIGEVSDGEKVVNGINAGLEEKIKAGSEEADPNT